jgi:hypothetical protein
MAHPYIHTPPCVYLQASLGCSYPASEASASAAGRPVYVRSLSTSPLSARGSSSFESLLSPLCLYPVSSLSLSIFFSFFPLPPGHASTASPLCPVGPAGPSSPRGPGSPGAPAGPAARPCRHQIPPPTPKRPLCAPLRHCWPTLRQIKNMLACSDQSVPC